MNEKLHLTINAPITLSFAGICMIALLLGYITRGITTKLFFSVYRSSVNNPLTWVRFLGHVFGHADLDHFTANISMILVLGPMLEEAYGSKKLLKLILITALSTGIVQFLFFPGSMLCGASGVVYMMFLLASMGKTKNGEIPLTFLFASILYLGGQTIQGIFVQDNISQLTHVLGGFIGAFNGYRMQQK